MQRFPAALSVLLITAITISNITGAQETPPTIRANVRLVEVNVVAQDRKGDPVTDLTRDDFVIRENGKVRPISAFSKDGAAESSAPVPVRMALPPLTFTNRHEAAASAVTVFLLDGLNTPFEEQAYAKRQLLKYLRDVDPHDRVALFSLGNDLRLVHDFTTDTKSLIDLLNRLPNRINTEVADSEPVAANTGDPDMDEFLNSTNARLASYSDTIRAIGTGKALEAIAAHISNVTGRKNLVWISAGFPIQTGQGTQMRMFTDEIRRAIKALNDADIAVYPVDAGGLRVTQSMSADAAMPRPGRQVQTAAAASPADLKYAAMGNLADETGGRVFRNVNDLAKAIQTATSDSHMSYTLGFNPPAEGLDGKYHELKVEVKRPGVHLRFRKGYMALNDPKPMSLPDAVSSPVTWTGLGITTQLRPAPEGVEMMLNIDLHNVTLEKRDQNWTGALEVLVRAISPAQRATAPSPKTVTVAVNLTPETYANAMKSGYFISTKVPMKNGDLLDIGVRDIPSGATGTLHVRRSAQPPK